MEQKRLVFWVGDKVEGFSKSIVLTRIQFLLVVHSRKTFPGIKPGYCFPNVQNNSVQAILKIEESKEVKLTSMGANKGQLHGHLI